jgi:DNA-directed RNA polymerase subunit RPC12/RpoP
MIEQLEDFHVDGDPERRVFRCTGCGEVFAEDPWPRSAVDHPQECSTCDDHLHWMYMCADCGHEFHVPGNSLWGRELPKCPVCDGPAACTGTSEMSDGKDEDDE